MPRARSREPDRERHVWKLLTRDFEWEVPQDFPVTVVSGTDAPAGPTRLQIFEIAIATIFASLRPDFEWCVTPNRPDSGLDFLGRHRFLEDRELRIAATVTIGGQCKKRTRVDNIVDQVSGSLTNMVKAIDPTFFIVAFSARLDRNRVEKAIEVLEYTHRRHCHILDRSQIEGLIQYHLPVVETILRKALTEEDVQDVLAYFEEKSADPSRNPISVARPNQVLAGIPFTVSVDVRSSIVSAEGSRLWWKPPADAEAPPITLISPIGADGPGGVRLAGGDDPDDPMRGHHSIELVTFAVGDVDLGELSVGLAQPHHRTPLGTVRVVENLRPRFFDRPYRGALVRLDEEYQRAVAGAIVPFAVVGPGGSGKSRLCEEFCLEKRRRGAAVVSAKQAQTLDDPHRVLAELFLGLVPGGASPVDPASGVIEAISRYDRALGERARPAICSLFGMSDRTSEEVAEQSRLSALILLIAAKRRHAPLIIHIQDLHWATADVLRLFDRLTWQLKVSASATPTLHGVLFLLEGRVHEVLGPEEGAWTSAAFEAFLAKLACPKVTCAAFDDEDGLEFLQRLFENPRNPGGLVDSRLVGLQSELIERIHRAAGSNPLHCLLQVQLRKQRRILGQDPENGLVYMIQPDLPSTELPNSVFESIELRWLYMKDRKSSLALLLWAAALLEDSVPRALFRRLWTEIAPDVSLRDEDLTDFLWTGDDDETDVRFRHENYFQTLRLFQVDRRDRERVVDVYLEWFGSLRTISALDQFKWAHVVLKMPEPDVARARALMKSALGKARRGGDVPLVRRISSASLDLAWSEDARRPVRIGTFLRLCDDELELTLDLLASDRPQAASRLENLRHRIQDRLSRDSSRPATTLEALHLRRLALEVRRSQLLFNDRQPAKAAGIAAGAVNDIRAVGPHDESSDPRGWESLEIKALHSLAAAQALSGEIGAALETSERAVALAESSASPMLLNVTSTHGNLLLATDPVAGEATLRECMARVAADPSKSDLRADVELNMGLALVVLAHHLMPEEASRAEALLAEAEVLLERLHRDSFQLGNYADAGAAALTRGIVSALRAEDDEVFWFAQAVDGLFRGRQMESLWRAHVNLATALRKGDGRTDPGVRNHARSALEIMESTLAPHPEPDQSPRFGLLRVGLAHIASFLIEAGDEEGFALLERHPGLRPSFRDPAKGILREDLGGHWGHEWSLRIGDDDYMLY